MTPHERASRRAVAALAAFVLVACSSSKSSDTPSTEGGTGGAGGASGSGGAGGASASGSGSAGDTPVGEGALGAADFADGELDAPSTGATITFEEVGGTGWYPSRRDPSSGDCEVRDEPSCCMSRHELTSEQLTPWNEELSMTLRGPLRVKQIAVYEEGSSGAWARASAWDLRGASKGIAFWGSGAADGDFDGRIGNVCELEVASDRPFPCGAGSVPYCTEGSDQHYGWSGGKLVIVLARSPHYGEDSLDEVACEGPGHGWHDAPWLGLSHGELVRSGRYSGCHCWSKPGNDYAQDGCGQFNVFEVVNDNNQYANLDLFSTNLVSYAGYVGEGPCGEACDASGLPEGVDLLDKSTGTTAAAAGAVGSPSMGPRAAFVRPHAGYRYFVTLLDVQTRTVQIALIHPEAIPSSIAALLPSLPATLERKTVDALVGLRLPR